MKFAATDSCSERACPRWVAEPPQNQSSSSTWKNAEAGLRRLRHQRGASPLTTGGMAMGLDGVLQIAPQCNEICLQLK